MPTQQGQFCWYELMTTDADAATAFYRDVVGWEIERSPMPGTDYRVLKAGGAMVGGLMTLPEEARAKGATTGWIGYIAVPDVDAAARRVSEAGGKIYKEPTDIPGIGRFAVTADPDGAAFILFRGNDGMEGVPVTPAGPGYIGWRELFASDMPASMAFYADQFGWTKAEAHDMGPMGVYQLFAVGGELMGGMMTAPPEVTRKGWQYYFTVADIAAAAKRVTDNGGTVRMGPHEVPGGQWIVQATDPQGGAFALVTLPPSV